MAEQMGNFVTEVPAQSEAQPYDTDWTSISCISGLARLALPHPYSTSNLHRMFAKYSAWTRNWHKNQKHTAASVPRWSPTPVLTSPVSSLNMAERTGYLIFWSLWPYVTIAQRNVVYKRFEHGGCGDAFVADYLVYSIA